MQFEFEDAEVAECELAQGVLTVRLSAAPVVHDSGEQEWMPLTLRLEGVVQSAVVQGGEATQPHLAGRLRGGVALGPHGERLRRIAVSARLTGGWTLELDAALGDRWCWQGTVLEVHMPPQCSAVAAYQC